MRWDSVQLECAAVAADDEMYHQEECDVKSCGHPLAPVAVSLRQTGNQPLSPAAGQHPES